MSDPIESLKGRGKHRNGGGKFQFLHVSASKSMIKAMKQNKRVQERVAKGELDEAMKTPLDKAKEQAG